MRKILVTTAQPLTDAQKKRLESGLVKKELDFEYRLDSKLVGGIVVEDGERVFDASFQKDLKDFRFNAEDFVRRNDTDDMISKRKAMSELPQSLKNKLKDLLPKTVTETVCGKVVRVSDGIIKIKGLATCRYGEILIVEKSEKSLNLGEGQRGSAKDSVFALAMNLEADSVGAMLLTGAEDVGCGDRVLSTGNVVEVPVGEELLGRIVNPLGQFIDGGKNTHVEKTGAIEAEAPAIIDRGKVDSPLETGILAIDSMIPIGKGQRELIIGDRQTGKTAIAVDAILNQKGKNVYCIYVAIGQRSSSIAKIVRKLRAHDALSYTTLVVSAANDSAALQYIAPYTGCAMAEELMKQGKDVLIVYDDLSKHAVAYRTISLLLKRPAGREAYPGDVFYVHSRLLERSAKLSKALGGGSITALPIIETQAGDISQYIPTNVISITDGQIYLETELFNAGIRPAVNVGLSVSRVGGAAQTKAVRKLSSQLRLNLAHYRELAMFAQFGSDLDKTTKDILESGKKTTEALKQEEAETMSLLQETVSLYLITKSKLTDVPNERISAFLKGFYDFYLGAEPVASKTIADTGELNEETEQSIERAYSEYLPHFLKEA